MNEEQIQWEDEQIEWETPTKPSIPQRLWTGAGRNIKSFVEAPSIIRSLGGMLEGGIETGVRAIQPAGPEYPPSPKGQAFQQGILDPLSRMVRSEVGKNIFTSNIPPGVANWAIDNPIDALMTATPLAPQKVQSFINPITFASKPMGKVLGHYFSHPEAQRLYTSSVNIVSKKKSLEDIRRTAQRGLDLGLVPNEAGLAKLKTELDRVGNQIDDIIRQGAAKGETIDSWKVTDYVDRVKEKFQSKIFHDPELDTMFDNIKQSFVLEYGEKMPVGAAQELKRTTQQFYANQFDRLQNIKAEEEKALEHGVRMELEKKYPALKTLNPLQQENVWLKEAIISTIKQEMRSKVIKGISFFNFIKNKTVDNPLLKSRVAIITDRIVKARESISPAVPTAIAAPFIGTEITDPYVQMANELLTGGM